MYSDAEVSRPPLKHVAASSVVPERRSVQSTARRFEVSSFDEVTTDSSYGSSSKIFRISEVNLEGSDSSRASFKEETSLTLILLKYCYERKVTVSFRYIQAVTDDKLVWYIEANVL